MAVTWPVKEAQRGTGGSLLTAASPDNQTGKWPSVAGKVCPEQSERLAHCSCLELNVP